MSDHYLEQLRHQLDQTRAELRRAEDELAVHRQRASRETRLRLAWQSARRRANWQRAILADYRTEAVARSLPKARDAASAPEQPTLQVRYATPVIKCEDCPRPWHPGYTCDETDQLAKSVRAVLDGVYAEIMKQSYLGSVFTDQRCCVCGTTTNGGHAFYENYQGRLFCGRCANGDRPSQQGAQEHECRVWEDEGEWNVSCLACDAYVDNVGNETDAEEWAEDHLEFGNQACGCWHSGCGHATTEPQP